jgi:hypothetical protein
VYERSAPGEVTDWQLRTFECRRIGEEDDPEMVERPYRKTTQTLYRWRQLRQAFKIRTYWLVHIFHT